MTQLLEDLRALDALFSDESKWTKNAPARDVSGNITALDSPHATCWCLWGGIMRSVQRESDREGAVDRAMRGALDADVYITWNDRRATTFADVKALIARAIATEEGRAGA